ncbi:hypothetical protein ACODT5_36990 [Streptomyces sp. 5.8]|uniref:hypothetical protein n=1 Tax=Streptomyces sp. 5.8 TaxID=3406571 RepID=UPI003BB7CBB8
MGLFTPKYPKSDTPGAQEPPRRMSRADRKAEAASVRQSVLQQNRFDELETESRERSKGFWADYDRRNPNNPSRP